MSESQPPGEPSLRDELTTLARARAVFAASILLDALFLVVVIPILAAFEQVRRHFHLHGLNEWFVVATEVLLMGGALATIAFYVFLDVRVAYRRFRDVEQGGPHGRE